MKTTGFILTLLLPMFLQAQSYYIADDDVVSTGSGYFYDGSEMQKHPGTSPESITFVSPTAEDIVVHFEEFHIPRDAYLNVYTGTPQSSHLIASYTGRKVPLDVSGTMITFVYVPGQSNPSDYPGWTARIMSYTDSYLNQASAAKHPASDCTGAIELCNQTTAVALAGQFTNTGSVSDEDGSCFSGTGSGGSVWYKFTPQNSGNLTFSLTPSGASDYDFVLYNGASGCSSNMLSNQLSCNFSAEYGATGLTTNSSEYQWTFDSFWYPDCSGSYYYSANEDCGRWNQSRAVTAGQTYYLMVNFYGGDNGGFTIDFTAGGGNVSIADNTAPALNTVSSASCGSSLTVTFNEAVHCTDIVPANFTLTGPGSPYTISVANTNCVNGLTSSVQLSVSPAMVDGSFNLAIANIGDHCGNNAPGNKNFSVSTHPAIYNVTGGGNFCTGSSGVSVGLSNSQTGTTYQLYCNGNPVGSALSGTGSALSLGSHTTAGTYTVVANNGCTQNMNGNAVITVYAAPVVSAGADDEVCAGGSITLDASGSSGSGTLSYSWSGGGSGVTYTVTPSGSSQTYTVTVTDGNSCTGQDQVTITVNSNPVPDITGLLTICSGSTTTLDAGSGYNTYNWSPSGSIQTYMVTAGGTYAVTVTDANGCTGTDQVTVTENVLPVAHANEPHSICFGEITTVDASGSTGNPTLSYAWDNGIGNGAVISVNPASTTVYQVTVTDGNGCSSTASTSVTVNPLPVFAQIVLTDITSCIAPNGIIQITGASGTLPYEYSLDAGAYVSTNEFTGVTSGSHTITIKDAVGCENDSTIFINNANAPQIDSIVVSHILCHGTAAGSITIYSQQAVSYSIDNGTTTATDSLFSGLYAGTYNIVVSDNGSCQTSAQQTISEPDTINVVFTVTDLSCSGDSSGAISAFVTGGIPVYEMIWTPTGDTTNGIDSLVADNWYSFEVTDQNGCMYKDSVMLSEPALLSVSATVQTIACHGNNNGSIDLNPGGGTPPYSFAWSNSSTDTTITQLIAGTYYYTITDVNNCFLTDSVTLTQPDSMTLSSSVTHAVCGSPSGSIILLAGGGIPSYTYDWNHDTGFHNDTATGLAPGTYQITVTDQNGCTEVSVADVLDQSTGSVSLFLQSPILCNGDSMGEIAAVISGGNPGFAFSWYDETQLITSINVSGNSDTLTGLTAGTYYVVITDSMNCVVSDTITIAEPSAMLLNTVSSPVHCYGSGDGSISIAVQGGTAPYQYQWNTGQQIAALTNITAGTYVATITDFNGCVLVTDTIVMTEPALFIIDTVISVPPLCYGGNDGSISIAVSGGMPDYTYEWSHGSSSPSLAYLGAGTYIVTIYDQYGCETSDTIVLNQPSPIVVADTVYTINALGNIELNISGGTPLYDINWSNGNSGEILTNLASGSYIVIIEDAQGCLYTDTFEIDIPLVIPTVITPNGDGRNDTWQILGIEAYETVRIKIFTRWGDAIFTFSGSGYDYGDAMKQWDGTWKGALLPMGSYVYILDLDTGEDPYSGVISIIY